MLLQNFKAMTIIMRVRKCLGGKLLGLQDKSPAIKGMLEFFCNSDVWTETEKLLSLLAMPNCDCLKPTLPISVSVNYFP